MLNTFAQRTLAAMTATTIIIGGTPALADEIAPAPEQGVTQGAPNGMSPQFNDVAYGAADAAATAATTVTTAVYNTIDPLIPDGTPAQAQLDTHYTDITTFITTSLQGAAYQTGKMDTFTDTHPTTEENTAPSVAPTPDQSPSPTPTTGVTMVAAATPAPAVNTTPAPAQAPAGSASVIDTARSMVGAGGFDCSGFVQAAYARQGITLPRTSYQQRNVGTPVPLSDVQPGDIVFFYGVGHVGIYAGNGQVIHSPGAGHTVTYESMAYMPASGAVRL